MASNPSSVDSRRPRGRPNRCACRAGVAVATAAILMLLPATALADRLMIKRPGAHPDYHLELEPHLNIGLIDPPGIGSGKGLGAGLRATIEVVDNGFVGTINNTIGVGFGLDFVHHPIDERDYVCIDSGPQPGDQGDDVCLETAGQDGANYLVVPVVMQWNFWLSEQWSVFGEPALLAYVVDYGGRESDFALDAGIYLGGRWHFADFAALTMRVGYPTFSVGASFLL